MPRGQKPETQEFTEFELTCSRNKRPRTFIDAHELQNNIKTTCEPMGCRYVIKKRSVVQTRSVGEWERCYLTEFEEDTEPGLRPSGGDVEPGCR